MAESRFTPRFDSVSVYSLPSLHDANGVEWTLIQAELRIIDHRSSAAAPNKLRQEN